MAGAGDGSHVSPMGMLNRRTVLLGLAGIGVAAVLADRTFVSSASALTGELTGDLSGLVADAQGAAEIAQTLQSGDPVQIQDLLTRLIDEEGARPENASAGLFSGLLTEADPEPAPAGPEALAVLPADGPDAVSMIITTPRGGLAVVNGRPMKEGDTHGGLTLLAVHPDRIVVERPGGRRVIRLPEVVGSAGGPSVPAMGP